MEIVLYQKVYNVFKGLKNSEYRSQNILIDEGISISIEQLEYGQLVKYFQLQFLEKFKNPKKV